MTGLLRRTALVAYLAVLTVVALYAVPVTALAWLEAAYNVTRGDSPNYGFGALAILLGALPVFAWWRAWTRARRTGGDAVEAIQAAHWFGILIGAPLLILRFLVATGF